MRGHCKLGNRCRYAHDQVEINDSVITESQSILSEDTISSTPPPTVETDPSLGDAFATLFDSISATSSNHSRAESWNSLYTESDGTPPSSTAHPDVDFSRELLEQLEKLCADDTDHSLFANTVDFASMHQQFASAPGEMWTANTLEDNCETINGALFGSRPNSTFSY
jgi:hypothetical protein